MEALGRWRSFLDSLSTDGGHIVVLLYIMMSAGVLFFFDATAGGQIMNLSFGALLKMLVDKGTNKDQMTGPPAMTATVTTAPAPQPTPTPNPEGEPK